MPRTVCWTSAPLLLLSGAASAQIVAVGPFAGPYREGFETQPAMRDTLYECLPGRIFAGTAELCDPVSHSIIVPQFWSLFCTATPHQGARYVLALESPMEITFSAPVTAFGGYFATVGGGEGGTVEFENAAGPLGSAVLTTSDCTYAWNGWESATPFTRVRIIGDSAFSDGGYVHMDDLEYRGAGPSCYPNCDGSTVPPVLNVLDFNCFLNRFSAGDAYANCDGSTAAPALNVLDFNCFLNRFSAGCP